MNLSNSVPEPGVSYVLAIDLGTGGPKVALVSSRGELIDDERRSIEIIEPDGGGAEQDPALWWSSIDDAIGTLLGRNPVVLKSVRALACTGQWLVVVPVDADGEPLMNAVHWLDTRGGAYVPEIAWGPLRIQGCSVRKAWRWVRLTSMAPVNETVSSLAHILLIKHRYPDVYRRTYKFLEPVDFLNFKLTGRFCASPGSIFPLTLADNRDSTHVAYDSKLLSWSTIDKEKLPEIVASDAVVGRLRDDLAERWGLSLTTQVVAGTIDLQAAALGAGATEDYSGYIYVGSTAWISCHIPFRKVDAINSLTVMPATIPGRNVVVAEQGVSGRCLEFMVREWLAPHHAGESGFDEAAAIEELEAMAQGVPAGSNGLLFLPWLAGLGAPVADSHMRGGFLNQSLSTGRAHAFRALLEGLSFNLKWLIGCVERFTGHRFPQLPVIGGLASSSLWCQILADVLERPIHRIAHARQAPVMGSAYAAFNAMGILNSDQLSALVTSDAIFQPQHQNQDVYRAMFKEFQYAYKRNRGLFSRLQAATRTDP